MKLSILSAQYFYQHRKLSLPGIGTFFLDDAVTIPDVADKNFRDFLQYIQFKQSNVQKPDEAFIDFIRTHTGKIKPLAESDLESYVADGKLLLNIGKPFHIEGIGTLMKNRNGIFEFTPGEPTIERLEAIQPVKEKEKAAASSKKSVFDEDYYPHESKGVSSRRMAIMLGIVLGLAVVIWGGYSLYNKKVENTEQVASDSNVIAIDSAALKQKDSLDLAKAKADSLAAASAIAPGSYKFIFETTTSKRRALYRHPRVSDINPRIKMESNADSTLFNIYVVLPGTPADTTRLKDSLNAWYYGSGPLKVKIEH